jgi:TolB protein
MMRPLLKILSPCLLAVLCFAIPVGTFDEETGVGEPGHVTFNPAYGQYTITGAGDIGGTSDRFHYVWKKVTGDVGVGADVWFNGNVVSGNQKAALMIRQSLDPHSAFAAAVLRSDGAALVQYRPDSGAVAKSTNVISQNNLTASVYVSFERRGDAFTMAVGKVGKMGGSIPISSPVTVTMNGPVYVGLAVASSDPATEGNAVFSNVRVQSLQAR